MEIIPAIDIIDGKCVRLTQGDYDQKKVYNEDPLEVAQEFEDAGLRRLHLVDLDGAKARHIVNHKVLEKLATKTGLHIDFGGGVKTDEDLRIAFESGAKQVTGGSIAVKDPAVFKGWLQSHGPEKIILGADVKGRNIAVSGWQEETTLDLFDFLADYREAGACYTICTDVSKDGLLQGPATDLYKEMLEREPEYKLIASGGVSGSQDLDALEDVGVFGVIIGKAIYEGRISLKELEQRIIKS
ncbi:1-(5-phosphoribosyl)-5-[(5-phosphoribosylamino)methylideneamino]imidazole-4-carboxamide isomerase [Roseivirga sp. BDSF3-8]|uniref:1-(5-phosphoribosyl)-5-[(5- phosphoribosylamino)methylideneamino]imidazole-4- carboxamide isomerase n=1 Tax=Roseivirga sp. BDSF3-8 TaxID=3241598 RepID=UPI003531EBBF